jgi:hypothetical protein
MELFSGIFRNISSNFFIKRINILCFQEHKSFHGSVLKEQFLTNISFLKLQRLEVETLQGVKV